MSDTTTREPHEIKRKAEPRDIDAYVAYIEASRGQRDAAEEQDVNHQDILKFIKQVASLPPEVSTAEIDRFYKVLGEKEQEYFQKVFTDLAVDLMKEEIKVRPVRRSMPEETPLLKEDEVDIVDYVDRRRVKRNPVPATTSTADSDSSHT